jgi:hypothetical protein
MDIEKVLGEKLDAIRSHYRDQTGFELHDASLWYYGADGWTIYLTSLRPRYESASASKIAFADIDAEAIKVADALAMKASRRLTPADIAEKTGLSEDELCRIVCAGKRDEAA